MGEIMAANRTRVSGVYGIYCKETGKWYVGGSVDIERRIKDHFYLLECDARMARHCEKFAMKEWGFVHKGEMGRDYWRFGPDAFEWQVLYTTANKAEILSVEKQFVRKFDSLRSGYNFQAAGRNRHWE